MLAYPKGTSSPATAPHHALQKVRENVYYLKHFLGPESAHDPDPAQPSCAAIG
jgi:hypothetical protein